MLDMLTSEVYDDTRCDRLIVRQLKEWHPYKDNKPLVQLLLVKTGVRVSILQVDNASE